MGFLSIDHSIGLERIRQVGFHDCAWRDYPAEVPAHGGTRGSLQLYLWQQWLVGFGSNLARSGSHINQGTVKINDTYFSQPAYNNPNEKNHVMCQEVGHTIGLGHTSEDGTSQNTCMDYSTSPTSTHPNQHDYDMLNTIYAHVDSVNTWSRPDANAPPAFYQLELDGPGQWGKLVDQSSDGRFQLYMLDFGHGYKIFTHVIWANPYGSSERVEIER